MIRLTGTLTRDAEMRVGTGARVEDMPVFLVAYLQAEPDGEEARAWWRMGTGAAAQLAAGNAAHHMRRGSRVTVHARSFVIVTLHAEPHLLLRGVDLIEHDALAGVHITTPAHDGLRALPRHQAQPT